MKKENSHDKNLNFSEKFIQVKSNNGKNQKFQEIYKKKSIFEMSNPSQIIPNNNITSKNQNHSKSPKLINTKLLENIEFGKRELE